MSSNSEREAIILGALLHDIGKFTQRAQKNPKEQKHTFWGEKWFTEKLSDRLNSIFDRTAKQIVNSAINNHHDSEKYISLADAISAGMERIPLEKEEEKGDPFTDRLISVLSRVSISGKTKEDKFHKLAYLGKDDLDEFFPISKKNCNTQEYIELLTAFNNGIDKLGFSRLDAFQAIEQIYFLLWKYTWCIPSAAYEDEPDVSLFDHLKTTAAIANCLYDYYQENSTDTLSRKSPSFQLVAGDISGIQSYIFEVLTQQGKVAKRLRARSLFVQLISEVASHKILHSFDLSLCNLLISSGGNFYILIPNIKDARQKLDRLQVEFDDWMFKKTAGELSLCLASLVVSGEELGNFSKVLEKLKYELSIRKYQPYKSILLSQDKWNIESFIQSEVIENDKKACEGCHKNPIEEGNLCKRCLDDVQIGKELPKSKYIAFFKNANYGYNIFDYSFELWDNYQEDRDAYLVLALNNTQKSGVGFKWLANYIPFNDEGPISFEDIAQDSQGDKLLGYLKADVDSLGMILKHGFLPKDHQTDNQLCQLCEDKYEINGIKPSISRYCSLSWMLEAFFCGYLQKRMEKDEGFKNIYTIFSGGDDFLLVGPWDKIIDCAKEIRDKFTDFCANNPDLTFSAGIILAKDHEPISFCVESADNELKKAKKEQNKEKDRVTIFGQPIAWKDLKDVLNEAMCVIRWLKQEPPLVSRAFIYNLRKYAEMSQKYIESQKQDTRQLKFVPLLTYDINRNLTKKEQDEVKRWATKLSPVFAKDGKETLPYPRIIMEYVLTYTRGGKDASKM